MFLTAASIKATANHPLTPIIAEFHRFITAPYHPFSTRTHLSALEYKIPLDLVETKQSINPENWKDFEKEIFLNQHIEKTDCPIKVLQESRIVINSFPNQEPFYTDGSLSGEKAGAGIFSRLCIRRIRIPNDYSIFDAEAYAIKSTLEFTTSRHIISVFFSDAQSVLKSIKTGTSTHPTIIDICNIIIQST